MSRPSWDALVAAAGLERIDARALLEHASGRRREWLIAHGDEPADDDAAAAFARLASRRRGGEPLAYLVGWREFHGRRFQVDRSVLVARPETELLVEVALGLLPTRSEPPPRLLDLGTGSGAVGLTVALERPDVRVVATDASPAALAVARTNAQRLRAGGVVFRLGDWWTALGTDDAPFDVVATNPPYVADHDPHLLDAALAHEPRAALASGPLGLDAIDAIVAGASRRLVPGGWIAIEHGHDQGGAVRERLRRAGFEAIGTRRDGEGRERVGIGRRPRPDGAAADSLTV